MGVVAKVKRVVEYSRAYAFIEAYRAKLKTKADLAVLPLRVEAAGWAYREESRSQENDPYVRICLIYVCSKFHGHLLGVMKHKSCGDLADFVPAILCWALRKTGGRWECTQASSWGCSAHNENEMNILSIKKMKSMEG